MSSTPRTDALFRDLYGRKIEAHEAIQIATEWAEQLETELSAANERIAGLERYKRAWDEWRSLQTGSAKKMMDEAMRCRDAELALSRANAALEMLPWYRDRFDDIASDATILNANIECPASMQLGLLGIREVAIQMRDSISEKLK